MSGPAYDLEIIETFRAAPATVFAAWTDTDRLVQWWRIPGYTTPRDRAAIELREGGVWSVTTVSDADGSSIPFRGTIRVADSPSRLVLSLDNEPSADAEQHSEMVIDLVAVAEGTRMEFHHHGFGGADDKAELQGGYSSVFFPSLAAYLASA